MKAIVNGKIIKENSIIYDGAILFNEKIVDIVKFKDINYSDVDEVIDAKGNYISPGFIDLHIHGSGGKDTMDGKVDSIKTISNTIAKRGVTAFLPTTMTVSKEEIYKALDIIKKCMNIELEGAKVLGCHLEGPFINENYKGAQRADYILKPSYDFIKDYKDVIKIITLAPEKDENFEFIRKVKNNTDIILSIGHSNATYEEAMESIDEGISHGTHTFNAMTPLHHRKPGIVGAIFNSDIYSELIADKIHVHEAIFTPLIKLKGKDKVILITDSMRAGCMKDGKWDLGGQNVTVKDGSARLEDGTLAGSILTLDKAVKNVFENTDIKIWEAVSMVTKNPAKDINIYNKKGSLSIGKDSDIIVFDEKFNVNCTIVEGRIVFKI
ncbi:N-acetylglucosamine-6-phosphate deacetylase [Clostridium oceanicum]|uniref:N-acetylglucosamine-6-phosphate deacetylase n=1 Tax=Clostridium oceanicum TaxID=1543 RepID=A0ABP3UXX6_9CLOT